MKEIKNNFSRNSKNSSAENNRANFIYELVGKVVDKKLKTDTNSQPFYQLTVAIENYPQVKAIKIFPSNLTKQSIWKEIEQSNYAGKEYLFYCKNYMGLYNLVDWKELKDHGSN